MKKSSSARAVKNRKRRSKDNSLNSLTKKFMLSAVQVIAEKIVSLKKQNDGKVPYGEFSKLWNAGKETYPKMSWKTINNYVKKIESAAENKFPSLVITSAHGSKVSNLTGSTLNETESISASTSESSSNSAESGSITDSESASSESIGEEVILDSGSMQMDLWRT
jgi:hypothetical protein